MNRTMGLLEVRWMIFSALGCAAVTGCGGQASGGSGGSSSQEIRAARTCESPESLGGNWERCADGTLHRSAPGTCENHLPTSDEAPTENDHVECTTDADCTEWDYGHCDRGNGQISGTFCHYGCLTDTDCDAGLICVCGEPVGHCSASTCTSDAECGDGLRCADYVVEPGCGGEAFACETPEDTCATDVDCTGTGGFGNQQCTFEGGKHQCQAPGCAIGRPFLVASEERLAGLVRDADWCERSQSSFLSSGFGGANALTASEARLVAAAWRRVGLMEHASIAAFARFVLQLLAVGAPPELVEEANGALVDETRHARLCFTLAQRYDGQSFGPGPLAMDGALDGSELRSLLVTAVLEGCVGETVAAVEAAEAAAGAVDPEVRAVLAGIAKDEARHATLAWKFVDWALGSAQSALLDDIERLFARVVSEEPRRAPNGRSNAEQQAAERVLRAHGHLPENERTALRSRVLQGVVAPAARALLDNHRARAAGNSAGRAPFEAASSARA